MRQKEAFSDVQGLINRVKGLSAATVRSWSKQKDVSVTFEDKSTAKSAGQKAERQSRDSDGSKSRSISFQWLFFGALEVLFTIFPILFWGYLEPNLFSQNGPKMAKRHVIYFECIDDDDCSIGQECFPGKLHPEERALNLSVDKDKFLQNLWVESKFGSEQVFYGSSLARNIRRGQLESGKRCWNISKEIGADCGDSHHQICDEAANLTCIYGKCRKTEDTNMFIPQEKLTSEIMGDGFYSILDAECESMDSLEKCLEEEERDGGVRWLPRS